MEEGKAWKFHIPPCLRPKENTKPSDEIGSTPQPSASSSSVIATGLSDKSSPCKEDEDGESEEDEDLKGIFLYGLVGGKKKFQSMSAQERRYAIHGDEDLKIGWGAAPPPIEDKDKKLWEKHWKVLHESRGYQADHLPFDYPHWWWYTSRITVPYKKAPIPIGMASIGYPDMCKQAIEKFKDTHIDQDPEYEFLTIENVTYRNCGVILKFYLTFKASRVDDPSITETFVARYAHYYLPDMKALSGVTHCELKTAFLADWKAAEAEGVTCKLSCCKYS